MTDELIVGGAMVKRGVDGVYTLAFRALLYGREGKIFGEHLAHVIGADAIADGSVQVDVRVGYLWEREAEGGGLAAGAEMTEVTIRGPRSLFERDPVDMRDAIEKVGRDARAEAAAEDERDRTELGEWADRFNDWPVENGANA